VSDRNTEALLQDLARDLRPVRTVPRLRAAALVTVGAWGLVAAAHAALEGRLPPLPGPWQGAASLGVLAGLVLAAAGGVTAALAGAIPGRERPAHLGAAALVLGLGFALAAAAIPLIGWSGAPDFSATANLACIGHAALLGVVPLAVLCVFLARALASRPRRGACAAALGGLALGGLAVHVSCAAGGGALHLLLGHALGPTLVALALALPAAALIRRSCSPERVP
jgi:hypothetical protein